MTIYIWLLRPGWGYTVTSVGVTHRTVDRDITAALGTANGSDSSCSTWDEEQQAEAFIAKWGVCVSSSHPLHLCLLLSHSKMSAFGKWKAVWKVGLWSYSSELRFQACDWHKLIKISMPLFSHPKDGLCATSCTARRRSLFGYTYQ